MLRRIEHLLAPAMNAVERLRENGKIKSGYQGAISGFGASVIQMGMKPTLAVYSAEKSGSEINRKALLTALHEILKSEPSKFSKRVDLLDVDQFLKQAIGFSDIENEELEEHLLQASIALKLALRTFKLD